ncbi:DUF4331 family protein [Frigoriflavimonas asaccharolytica]|uniref:DUF4331 domain-containing protein n=1 Tax=Frigoriflavimonas asaccharolytica TaxID=2735899 RepID=A0A8J8G3Z1_9FLAO|nr:DUF4331 family protein [Frigoriflavimonas asaccharolytica]NRS91033.1 hypothetical protein [Frigoriflavimonas asaccharolytica]
MKNNIFKILALSLMATAVFTSCNDNDEFISQQTDFSGTFVQADQMGRPAINTVFIASGAPKNTFNTTIPSAMGAAYQSVFQTRLMNLNPAYTTNALGQTAAQFTGLLATDVLGVSKVAPTTFFDGTNVLTGRALADDVIDTELLLIFGGPGGTSNPGLTKDNVNSNDKPFLTSFPYLASAW